MIPGLWARASEKGAQEVGWVLRSQNTAKGKGEKENKAKAVGEQKDSVHVGPGGLDQERVQ